MKTQKTNMTDIFDEIVYGITKVMGDSVYEIWYIKEKNTSYFIGVVDHNVSPMVAQHLPLMGFSLHKVGKETTEKFPGTKIQTDYGFEGGSIIQKLRKNKKNSRMIWYAGVKYY